MTKIKRFLSTLLRDLFQDGKRQDIPSDIDIVDISHSSSRQSAEFVMRTPTCISGFKFMVTKDKSCDGNCLVDEEMIQSNDIVAVMIDTGRSTFIFCYMNYLNLKT